MGFSGAVMIRKGHPDEGAAIADAQPDPRGWSGYRKFRCTRSDAVRPEYMLIAASDREDEPPIVADLSIETDDGYIVEGPANVRAFRGTPYGPEWKPTQKWELTIRWDAPPTARALST